MTAARERAAPDAPRRTLVAGLMLTAAAALQAQTAVYENEPNDTPAEANAIRGRVVVSGTMAGNDQDGFVWTVSDDDARKRWTFELEGIPGQLTIAEVVRVAYTDDGTGVAGTERLMKMGTRDGVTPAVTGDLLFEPGDYLIGIAHAGGGSEPQGGMFRPPAADLSFGASGRPQTEGQAASAPADPAPGGYRFTIREGSRLVVSEHPPPRETREAAQKLRPGREFATFETDGTAWYAIAFDEKDTAQRWDVRVQVPVGRELQAELIDAAGKSLVKALGGPRGRLTFADLAPPAGTLYVKLSAAQPGFIHAIASEAVGARVAGEEAEPNDKWELANRVDLSQPLTGRMGTANETDWFRFAVGEAAAGRLQTLGVTAEPAGQQLEVCLLDGDRVRVQCRRGEPPIELPDLALNEGSWGLSVSRGQQGLQYRVTLTDQGPIERGREVEPNDAVEYASSVPANNRIKGRFSSDESDFYRFVVVDDPQLWRFQVIGDGIDEVVYYDGAGKKVSWLRPARGQRRVRLENLFLLPGQHFLSVSGRDGGAYTVLARALGPPDPDGEREPNDDSRMQRLAMGQTRTGVLSHAGDSDYYRFFLGNLDHVRLTVQPPADGVVEAQLSWYGSVLAKSRPGAAGEPLTLAGLFPPGDYAVRLSPRQRSDAEYRIGLERLPRFGCPSDCEPNGTGSYYAAAPVPPSHVLEGRSNQWNDDDPYELPTFDRPTGLFVHSAEPVRRLLLGRSRFDADVLTYDADRGGYAATVPAGGPYRLIVESPDANYRLVLDFEGQPPGPMDIAPLPVDLTLDLDHEHVSAYRPVGQRVSGSLALTNHAGEAVALNLEAATSDYRWQVSLERDRISVPPGETLAVPLTVDVPADAWANRPVRISARAGDAGGAQVETWAELDADRDLPPVAPTWGWSVPAALRGGFNAAWAPFGAALTGDVPRAHKLELPFDGMVYAGARLECCSAPGGWGDAPRPSLTLDLPGDAPLPVAGIAVDSFGSTGPYRMLRRATLLLSNDGQSFQEARQFDLLPVLTEQYVALDAPIEARFARLRFDQTFDVRSGAGGISLGEWKVILQPGYDLSAGAGYNLADPILGGHLVSDRPPRFYSPKGVLDEAPDGYTSRVKNGTGLEYVIGFHDDRAAQIRRAEWVYADDTDPAQRFARLIVAASVDSPVGPWRPLGELDAVGADGTAMLALDEPAWARFVKFTVIPQADARAVAAPQVIRILERATGPDYRSVLTEWGYGGARAGYEAQAGLPPEPEVVAATNTSRAAAATLAPSQTAAGQVQLGGVEHWYRLSVPAGQNTLTLHLTGDPGVRTRVDLEDASGAPIAAHRLARASTTREHVFEAVVMPASDVWLHVYEPPRNVVFSWDTSASVIRWLPTIYNALAAFSSQVIPGQEAVNLVPFGRGKLLRDWYGEPYVLQTILNDYPRDESSSAAELTLQRAAEALAPLAGTKSVVVITDGITNHHGPLWQAMRDVQPRVFGVQVGGDEPWNQDVFQDWAAVNGGAYTQLHYQGEMEIAFDRAAALMRRPAGYTLRVDSAYREAPGPGRLRVVGGDAAATGGGAAVELILDASGSMLQRMQGKRRINVARDVLTEAVTQHIPAGTPVALRVFGHKEPDACRTDLEIPLAPLDPERAAQVIAGIRAMNLARTPIADSLAAVERDLKGAEGRATVVLVTDGEETCEGDPGKVIELLQGKGFDVSVNIVGFAIDDADLEAQFENWADLGGGNYFSARDQQGLSAALAEALQVPFTVYDPAGSVVAEGVVGGAPVELEQGTYRVEVATAPVQVFEAVAVPGEQETTLRLK